MAVFDFQLDRRRAIRIAMAVGLFASNRVCLAQVIVHVLARPRLSAAAQCTHSRAECLIKGSLVDDLGSPLANQEVQGELETQEFPTLATEATLDSCEEFGNSAARQAKQTAAVHTDESGVFCFRFGTTISLPNAYVTINYPGGLGYDSVQSRVSLARSDLPASLKVLSSPNRIAIESHVVTIAIEVSAPGQEIAGLPITLALLESPFRAEQSKENVLSRAKTNADGIAHFAVSGYRFGAPGMARLVARIEGSRDLQSTAVTWPIMRTCRVQLQTHIETANTEVGDLANVLATATSACGAVPEGSIEFLVNMNSQVTLPLIESESRWQLSTFQFAPGDISIGTRYVPASTAWTGDEISLANLRVRPISGTRRALWLSSGFLIVAFLAFRWGQGNRHKYRRSREISVAPNPQSLDVEPSSSPDFGWLGIVIDSHTGLPIVGATVSIEMPGFSGTNVVQETGTTADGIFTLAHWDSLPRAMLVVLAPKYLRAQWIMPRSGKLVVRLETRTPSDCSIICQLGGQDMARQEKLAGAHAGSNRRVSSATGPRPH